MEKVGRNDPCPCGSGKKFKKCCASKMIDNRFMAHKIEGSSLTSRITQATSGIGAFFKDKVVTNITATKGFRAKTEEPGFQPVGLEEFENSDKELTMPQEPLEATPALDDISVEGVSKIEIEPVENETESKTEEENS